MHQLVPPMSAESDGVWRQHLCRGCCVIVGLAALLMDTIYLATSTDWVVISYLTLVASICVIGYQLTYKGYVFHVALVLSTIMLAFCALVPSDRYVLEYSSGAALVIPTCFMGAATRFRYGLIFSGISVAMLLLRALLSPLPWSILTTNTTFIIVVVTGLLFVMDRLTDALEQRNAELKRLSVQLADLEVAKERNRIARDFHDSLGAHFSALSMQLRAAKVLLPGDPSSAMESLVEAQHTTKEALQEVRATIVSLRASPTTNRPLPDAIGALVARNDAAGIPTTLQVIGVPRSDALADEVLYRAAQESLTNIRKHAQATQADVVLDYTTPGTLRLTIEDDGIGAADLDGGFGLFGIHERVTQIGGIFHVTTAPYQGMRIAIEVRA